MASLSSVKVGQKSSTYNGITVYERQIQELVGMSTYASLYFLYPHLYYKINYPMEPQDYYVQLIQSVMVNSNYLPEELKAELVKTCITKDPNPQIKPLIGSSKPTQQWESDFFPTAWFLLMLCLFAVILIWLIYIYVFKSLLKEYS